VLKTIISAKFIWYFISLLIIAKGSYAQDLSFLDQSELLEYRIHLGFINAAKATVKSSPNVTILQSMPTRKIEIEGKTIGILDMFSPVIDYWSANLAIETRLPLKTEMRKIEGRYKKNEVVIFDQNQGLAKIYSPQNAPVNKTVPISKGMMDLIGGYFFLRDKNLTQMRVAQSLNAKILFDGTIYDILFIVKGFENVDGKLGTKKCIRTSLVLPKNNMFKDEDAIRLWISQDKYQIPFKMEVNLKIGFLSIDLENYMIQGKSVY
jgi:hypothetical protein